jgi:hypothetical protein
MMIDFTEREICLIVQSVEGIDWSYAGETATVDSVVRKCKQAAAKIVQQNKKDKA